jgi:ATP/maltotriose-dependent transcriptional regulator MalT
MRERWRRAKPPAARPRPILVPDRFSAHVDEIAVEKAMAGDRVPLTVRERAIVVRRLTAAGLSARRIGERLGVTARSVQRYRSGETARWVA